MMKRRSVLDPSRLRSYRMSYNLSSAFTAIIAILSIIVVGIVASYALHLCFNMFIAGLIWQPILLGFGATIIICSICLSVF